MGSLNPDVIKEFLRLFSSERLNGPGVPGGGGGGVSYFHYGIHASQKNFSRKVRIILTSLFVRKQLLHLRMKSFVIGSHSSIDDY